MAVTLRTVLCHAVIYGGPVKTEERQRRKRLFTVTVFIIVLVQRLYSCGEPALLNVHPAELLVSVRTAISAMPGDGMAYRPDDVSSPN